MNYAKIEFLSISGVIFSPASGGSATGPDLPLLLKLHDIWLVDSQENHKNCCHQVSDFKAKMHQKPLPYPPFPSLASLPLPFLPFP